MTMLSCDGGRAAPGLPPHRNRSPEDWPRPPPPAHEIRRRSGRVLSAETVSGEDVAAALNSLGLFGAGRLIVVQGVEKWKKADVEALDAYLADPVAGTVVALVVDEPGKDDTLGKLVARRGGEVLAYDVPKPKDPSVWVRGEFARLGAQATDDAARRLVEIAGDDIALLEQEVEKLATWAGGEQIGPREVEELAVPDLPEAPTWALSDAWGAATSAKSSPPARPSSRRASSPSSSPSGWRRRSAWSERSRLWRTKAWAPGRSPGG